MTLFTCLKNVLLLGAAVATMAASGAAMAASAAQLDRDLVSRCEDCGCGATCIECFSCQPGGGEFFLIEFSEGEGPGLGQVEPWQAYVEPVGPLERVDYGEPHIGHRHLCDD